MYLLFVLCLLFVYFIVVFNDSVVVFLSSAGMSDWEIMIMRRKEAMAKARKRRKRDIDITAVDDHIMAMIRQMRQAAEVRERERGIERERDKERGMERKMERRGGREWNGER